MLSNQPDEHFLTENSQNGTDDPQSLRLKFVLSDVIKKERVKYNERSDAAENEQDNTNSTSDDPIFLHGDVEMEDGNDSMQSISAPLPFSKDYVEDTDSNTETESNFKQEDMDVSIAVEDKSQDDKDSHRDDGDKLQVRTRNTRSSSFDSKDNISNSQGHEGGKSRNNDDLNQVHEKCSRSATTAERELLGFREPNSTIAAPSASFLDSLSEEERKVRTRHLPDVSGFRRLLKAEIKRDLALVRKMLKTSKGSKKTDYDDEKDSEIEKMGLDENFASENDSQQSDEELHISRSKPGLGPLVDLDLTRMLENPDLSNIFSLPYAESPYICTDVEEKSNHNQPPLFSSPQVVESINSFNPPRPPESVGPKKIHRLNRWERSPRDVEVDLRNYRKTVDRTRQELHRAENERHKIGMVGQLIRSQFVNHLQSIHREADLVNDCYELIQGQCIKAAELLTSKTRSRGTGRGANIMKDVLSVLKSRGEKGDNFLVNTTSCEIEQLCSKGLGGLANGSLNSSKLASGWLLIGNTVASPFGIGIITRTFGPSVFNDSEDLPNFEKKSSSKDATQSRLTSSREVNKNEAAIILPPRICVKLPFGVGYFVPEELDSLENVASYSDEELAERWMSMIDSSQMMGTSIDASSVDNFQATHPIVSSSSSNADDTSNDDWNGSAMPNINKEKNRVKTGKLLPFGSSLFPSSTSRGGGIETINVAQLEETIGGMLSRSYGALGTYDNSKVPQDYKNWEQAREELRRLEGTAMQLKNKILRQKRIRYMNERSYISGENRRRRFELLLSDMKSDLDSLKCRLQEELNELDIDLSLATVLLSEYYKTQKIDDLHSCGEKRKLWDEVEELGKIS